MPAQSVISPAVATITKTITVAAGVFAPGHLGELTRVIPFELADAVLEDARAAEWRLRLLPSRVGSTSCSPWACFLGWALDAATKGERSTLIFLRADKAVPYGELMEIMNLLRKAGYLKVSLVALEKITSP